MNDKTLIIGLSVALILAVGLVFFSVGRVVICIVREARRTRKHLPSQIQHLEFGALTLDGELWNGQVQRDGQSIDFIIAGTKIGPDIRLVERLREIIRRFPEFNRVALEYIHLNEPSLPQEQFSFESLDLLFEKKPEIFGMGFTLSNDPDGCWRVEFDNERPQFVGRDD